MKHARMAVAGMVLSMAAFVGLTAEEHFTEQAVIPTKGDRPTVGFGSTFWEDGTPVKMGDRITPVRAVHLASIHVSKEENIFRKSLPGVMLSQAEYDIYMKWVYQFGTGNWMRSSMRKKLILGDYAGACGALLAYRYSAGYDCSTMVNGRRNKVCWGVWTRQQERHKQCMEAQ